MRHASNLTSEKHLFIRSLSVNYPSGGKVTPHSHSWAQLLYAEAGALRATAKDRVWIIPPRTGLIVPPHTRHALSLSAGLELRTLYFSATEFTPKPEITAIAISGLLHEAILRICSLGFLDERQADDRHLGAVVAAEMRNAAPHALSLPWPEDQRALTLAEAMSRSENAHVSLTRLCNKAGLSRRTAERLFQAQTGISPALWRRLLLLSESMVAIMNGQPIDVAAEQAGYHSRSAFSEAFVKTFGFPPGKARHKIQTK